MIPKEIREKVELVMRFNNEIFEYLRHQYNFKDYTELKRESRNKFPFTQLYQVHYKAILIV